MLEDVDMADLQQQCHLNRPEITQMKTMQSDFAAFLKKVAHGTYERRADHTSDLTETLNQISEKFSEFKSNQESRISKIETRLSRPGAFVGDAGRNDLRMLKSVDGREFPLLGKGDRLASRGREGADFSIGEFCREAIVGSQKAVGRGPALVPIGLSDQFIDDVRAQTVIAEAGARTVVIDGPRTFAKITQDPTVYQHTENQDDIVESDMLATPVTVDPKMLVTIVPMSEEVAQDSPNLDQIIRTSLAAAFAQKLEALALAKLIADPDIPESAAGQDPALWQKCLEAVSAAMTAGQPLPSAMISAAADFMSRAAQTASTSGAWLGKPPALENMLELPTSNLIPGTGFFGDFAQGLLISSRSELRLEVIRWSKPTQAQHALVAHARLDVDVVKAKALFRQLKTVA